MNPKSNPPQKNALKRLLSIACILSLTSATTSLPACSDEAWPGADDAPKQEPKPAANSDDMIFDGDSSRSGEEGQSAREATFSGSSIRPIKKETPSVSPVKHTQSEPSHPRTLIGSAKATMLYGRIDQIASEADVKMPELKAMKAQLDTSQSSRRLTASTSTARFSGQVTDSFPMDFSGLWGGTLRVWRYSASRLSEEIDADESRKMAEILTPGTSGDVNFVFNHDTRGQIDLEPANVRIMIPMQESYSYQKMVQGGQLGGLGGMVSKMMGNMKMPVMLHFGQLSTGGTMEVGISGNQIDQRLLKNEIRQLRSDVVEEQIVTSDSSVVQSTGRMKKGYTETVMRFTRRSPQDLYVLAASVDYDSEGKFLRKLIMYGDVFRNQRMDTSMYPAGMGNLEGLLKSGGGASGLSALTGAGGMNSLSSLGGLSRVSSMLGGSGAGGSQGSLDMSQMQQYLNNSGLGGAAGGVNGFSQVLNSLNMLNR